MQNDKEQELKAFNEKMKGFYDLVEAVFGAVRCA